MIEDFLIMEKENGWLEESINDFSFWIFIRDKLYFKIEEMTNLTATKKVKDKKSFAAVIDRVMSSSVVELVWKKIRFIDILHVLKNLTIGNPLFHISKADILIFTSNRRTLINGKYYEIWTDEIADYYGSKCLTVESLDVTSHSRPIYTKRIKEIDVIDIIPVITSLFKKFFSRKTKKTAMEKATIIDEQIKNRGMISPGRDYICNLILIRYFWHQSKKRIVSRIIRNVNPKLIMEVVGYETNNMIVNEVAKSFSIPTIELQHGIIGMQHIAYNYLERGNYKPLPDYLFFYAQYWKETCRFPIDDSHQIPVGFPFFENQIKTNHPIPNDKQCLRILVLSQPIYKNELISFIDRLLDLFEEKHLKFSMGYKLHPSEFNKPVNEWDVLLRHKNVELINNSSETLYHVFSRMDIQIGITSTAIFEGLAYGLNTFIIDIGNARERMRELISRNLVSFCLEPAEIANSEKLFSKEKTLAEKSVFFEPNSTNNMIQNINRLLK